MRSLQLSLVSNSGLLLASIPETDDDTKQILASSIISAIITFAKEVHRQELQSISYHDRNISFIQVHNFIFIVEILIANLIFSERQLNQILEQIKISANSLLIDRDPNMMSVGEAELILEHCLHDIYNLPLFFTRNPLKSAEPYHFTIIHDQDKFNIEEKVGSGAHIRLISEMISKHKLNEHLKNVLRSFIMLLPEQKVLALVIIDSDGRKTEVGMLTFPSELDYAIFRIYPSLESKLEELYSKDYKNNMLDILDVLQRSEDPGNRFSRVKIEDISLAFLTKATTSNLENAIYAAIVDDPMLVVGDMHTVKLVIDTLSIFSQHNTTNMLEWIDTEEQALEENITTLSSIYGMPHELYRLRANNGLIDNKTTIIDLETGRVGKGIPSYYFMNLFDTNINQDISKISVTIFNELRKLVSMALIYTSLIMYEKEKAQQMLDDLSLQSLYPQSFIRKAIDLAKKRNKVLELIL